MPHVAARRGLSRAAFSATRRAASSSPGACASSTPTRAPAARAAWMLACLDSGKLRQRIVAPRGLVALTAVCVMLSDPWAVQSAGAWLSVGAVAAVIWAGRATERQPKIVRLLAPAAAATLVTAPITAYVFGTVAPIGVLANLAAIPLAGLAVPGLMVALLLSSSWLAEGSGLCRAF